MPALWHGVHLVLNTGCTSAVNVGPDAAWLEPPPPDELDAVLLDVPACEDAPACEEDPPPVELEDDEDDEDDEEDEDEAADDEVDPPEDDDVEASSSSPPPVQPGTNAEERTRRPAAR
jgi:hypothetical protein